MVAVNLIYIGQYADADTNESNLTTENVNMFLGTYDNSVMQYETVDVADGGDSIGHDNDMGNPGDMVTYNIGFGSTSSPIDSSQGAVATVTLGDGGTFTTNIVIIQLANGDTFVTEDLDNGDLDNQNIQSIRVDSIIDTNHFGWWTSQNADFVDIVCFAEGTRIRTLCGERPIEQLVAGENVLTVDGRVHAIRWISGNQVRAKGRLAPVRIEAGALGAGLPTQTLWVSQQHRILTRSKIAARMFGSPEALIPAKKLVGLPGITIDESFGSIRYYHFALDRHEVVFANGAPAETLFLGDQSEQALGPAAWSELSTIFPELANGSLVSLLARPTVTGPKNRKYLRRLLGSGQSLIDG